MAEYFNFYSHFLSSNINIRHTTIRSHMYKYTHTHSENMNITAGLRL